MRGIRSAEAAARSILPVDNLTGIMIRTKNVLWKVFILLPVILCRNLLTVARIMKISSRNASVSRGWSLVQRDKPASAKAVEESTPHARAELT